MLLATVGALASCGPGQVGASRTITGFVDAIQHENVDRLYCLMAGAAVSSELGSDDESRREAFAEWALARYLDYSVDRDSGRVELDEQGIVLVKLFALGRGTFFRHTGSRRIAEDAIRVESEVRFGYDRIDLSGFTPGTTLYVSGAPAGRVHAVQVPGYRKDITLEVLDRIRLLWTLAREEAAGSCEAGWKVAAVEPVEGSAMTKQVTWAF